VRGYSGAQHMRILLVEDDPSTAQAITAMLRKEDWVIDSTDLGEDGLDLGKIYDYDLIILDLMLPDMDGMEVLKILSKENIASKIVLISGDDLSSIKNEALHLGAKDFLKKPISKIDLKEKLDGLFV